MDIDAASYVFSAVGEAAEGADAAAMATKEEEDEARARSRGEGAAAATAVRRRKEGIDDDDDAAGAEVDGVALLQLRETAAAVAAPRMPCKRRVPR